MTRFVLGLATVALLATAAARVDERPTADSNFEREGDAKHRKVVDPLEWKLPPELKTETWVKGEPTTLAKFRGNVVLIDFWGNW